MNNRRLTWLIPLLWLGLGLSLASPSATGAGSPEPAVTVAMSVTPLSAPFIIAEENGGFADLGLDLRIVEVIGGHRAAKALFDGEADIATSSEAVTMFSSFRRDDFRLFCTFVSSTNDVKLLTRGDSGIDTIQALAGRRVGTVTGASAHFFLDEVAALNGLDPARMEVVHVSPEGAGEALSRGEVDAVAIWEPWIHLSRRRYGDAVRLIPHDRPYIETFNALVMEGYAKRHPEVLERVVRALIRAVDWIERHPREAVRRVAARLNMDPEVVGAVWRDLDFDVTLNQSLLNTLESEARWAIGRHLVEGESLPNYLNVIHPAPLRRVAPEKIGLF